MKSVGIHSVGDGVLAGPGRWTFQGEVCEHFDAHVAKSVPLYSEGHRLIIRLSDYFLGQDSVCYDLGCSTGQLLHLLAARHRGKSVAFVGVDCERDMVERAKARCLAFQNVAVYEADLRDVSFRKADLMVSYYTLQFVRRRDRPSVLRHLYETLAPGGALLLFEKVSAPDARLNDMLAAVYMDYKFDQGYTSEEVVAKSQSLRGVLDPATSDENRSWLRQAGFETVLPVLKYACFEGVLALKGINPKKMQAP